MSYKYLFGPVNSRRLGISLGVDMVPFKTCSLDCVYCECGNTTELACDLKEYVSFDDLRKELDDYLSKHPKLDYVTFAGSGEPTLNSCLGKIEYYVKTNYPDYKTALLTNGTLFFIPEVRKNAMHFDLICPSLDAVSDEAFVKINRPSHNLDNKTIIDGLTNFAHEFKGQLWVEVFIVPGINDSISELGLLKEKLLLINPDRVQINSLDRPGTCDWVTVPSHELLDKVKSFLAPLPVEIISRSRSNPITESTAADIEETVVSLIRRRPSTIEELSAISGRTIDEISSTLNLLTNKGMIEKNSVNKIIFYQISQK